MRNIFTIFAAALLVVATLAMASCKKDSVNGGEGGNEQAGSFNPQSLEDYYGTVWANDYYVLTFFEDGARLYCLDGEGRIEAQYYMDNLVFMPGKIRYQYASFEFGTSVYGFDPYYELGELDGENLKTFECDLDGNIIKSLETYHLERDFDLSSLKFAEELVPEAIDLGEMYTTSGVRTHVKWAKWNLGALKESDFGLHYAWGELEQKPTCTSENYLYNVDVDELPSDRDAASVRLGNEWRMPTGEEINALANTSNDQTNFSWTYKTVDGVQGWLIKRKTGGEGIKDNSIFLPLAQYIKSYGLYTGSQCGFYWSSTGWSRLMTAHALCLHTDSESNPAIIYGDQRIMGDSIRPVISAE